MFFSISINKYYGHWGNWTQNHELKMIALRFVCFFTTILFFKQSRDFHFFFRSNNNKKLIHLQLAHIKRKQTIFIIFFFIKHELCSSFYYLWCDCLLWWCTQSCYFFKCERKIKWLCFFFSRVSKLFVEEKKIQIMWWCDDRGHTTRIMF